MNRCDWCLGINQDYINYHDKEWGVPVHDERKHFEFLILEGAQAGLSWATILKRRAGYRAAFSNFDPQLVASYDEDKISELIVFQGIIRNKLKIRSAVTNAKQFLKIQEEFGSFDHYIWSFVEDKSINNEWTKMSEVPATSTESDALSRDLKKRGFKFTGSTIMYAHMQACGLVNDHLVTCFRHREIIALQHKIANS